MSDNNIYPTHTCFDDALEFFPQRDPRLPLSAFTVVHAICLTPRGERYAHAWVEHCDEALQQLAIQAGIHDGERIWYGVPLAVFRERSRVQHETRYTPLEALRENHRTGYMGPWVAEYKALSDNNDGLTWDTGLRMRRSK